MSDEKISQLQPGTTLSGAELIPAVQNGVTVAINPGMIKTYIGTTPVPIQITNPSIYGLAPGGQLIYSLATLTAASAGTKGIANYLAINDSGAQDSGGYMRVLQCDMNILGGATLTGSRAAANFTTTVSGKTGNSSASPVSYGGVNIYTTGQVNDGGTALTTSLASPNISCLNPIVTLLNGATFYYGASGMEIDSSLQNGSSVVLHRGLAITHLPPTKVRGSQEDAAISIGSQDPSLYTQLTNVSCVGSTGQFAGTLSNLLVGDSVKITGTNTGSGSISGYVSGNQYYVSATDGVSTFTLQNLKDNSVITTSSGSLTGLTFKPDWGTYGWEYGWSFASTNPGVWPYARDSIIMGSPKAGTCAAIIDSHLVTCFQYQVKMVGYLLDPVGNLTAQTIGGTNLTSQPTSAPTVDAGNIGFVASQTGLAMIMPSSGTMANNGAITLTTALPTTYANCYLYLPAGAIAVGSLAGWYFSQMTSATLGTVFNNTWTNGTPTIPAAPTPFVTTGPGAYTQTITSTFNGASVTIGGNALGNNGSLEADAQFIVSNSGNAKTVNIKYGTQIMVSQAPTTQTNGSLNVVMRNRGAPGTQVAQGFKTQTNGSTLSSGGFQYFSVDSTVNENAVIGLTLANATDYIVLESFSFKVYPN